MDNKDKSEPEEQPKDPKQQLTPEANGADEGQVAPKVHPQELSNIDNSDSVQSYFKSQDSEPLSKGSDGAKDPSEAGKSTPGSDYKIYTEEALKPQSLFSGYDFNQNINGKSLQCQFHQSQFIK